MNPREFSGDFFKFIIICMAKFRKELLIFTITAVSVPLVVLLLIHFTPEPPVSEMECARVTISMAGKSKADSFSKKLFNEAKIYYDSALANWHKENKRFLYFRDYEKVAMFAELSAKKANEASESSIINSSSLKFKLIQEIDSLNNLISEINYLFHTYPLTSEIRDRISRGKLFLKEAEIANSNHQYLLANRKISDAEYLLTASYSNVNENLQLYFKSYPEWNKWINKTISDSRKNRDYSIIIDKFSRKCFIYLNGVRKYEYEADLGRNWVGDKRVRGDKATPEGMYKITKKLEGNKTKYYKALLLNYPNDDDKKRFKSEFERGSLPTSATIGNLIEIHGNGGKGADWTDGCVALTDTDMDTLFKIAKPGTAVTIVGSMVDLKNIVKR